MTFGSAQIFAYTKMRNNKPNKKPTEKPTNSAPSKPKVVGMNMMTFDDMRNHKHTENPQCACHDIDEVLAKVPENQQNQFVRVCPSSAPPRYANHPTGVSMFRERLSLDVTAPKISGEQPQRSLDSMVMVPETTGENTGMRGFGEEQRRNNRQACVPQVKDVVASFFKSAVEVVKQRSISPSPHSNNSISDEEPFSVFSKLPGIEKLSMPQPPPPAAVPLQRSNAIRYRDHPRPQSRDQQDATLCYYPGGEADSHYLQDVEHERPGRHPTRPDSPIPNPQQWEGSMVKGMTYSHVQCYAVPSVRSPQYRSYADMVDDGAHPRLCVMNRTPASSSPSSPSSSYGSFAAKDVNFREKLAVSASLCYPTDIPDDISTSSSSSWPDYPKYHYNRPHDVPDGISEAFGASRRFCLDEWSIGEAVPAKSRFSLCSSPDGETGDTGTQRKYVVDGTQDDVSDGIPEATPASRRFSLGEWSADKTVPAESRFPLSSLLNGHHGDIGVQRWWATNTHRVDDDTSEDADDEGDEESSPNCSYYVRQGPLMVRNASVSRSSEGSVPARAPTGCYYTQDSDETSEGYIADNDLGFYEELYEEPNSDNDSQSIDQSHFADFDGDFTGVPSLTNGTSPANSSESGSGSRRVLRVVNETSHDHDAGSENGECPSECDANDELPQRGRSRTRRA